MSSKFVILSIAVAVHAVAIPESNGLGANMLSKRDCPGVAGVLLLAGCTVSDAACEFCCPEDYSPPSNYHCHGGHDTSLCGTGTVELHCEDHDEEEE